MRLIFVFVIMAILFALPFVVFGERMEGALSGQRGLDWLRSFGPLAGLVGVGLLIGDVVLPVPSTAVMTALGLIYGPTVGAAYSVAGSFLAGLAAYWAARALGPKAAVRLVEQADLERARGFFERRGGWAVAASRALPILAEVVAVLAGLAGMPARRCVVALACGAIPVGVVYAGLGAVAEAHPVAALTASALLPVVLWPVAKRATR